VYPLEKSGLPTNHTTPPNVISDATSPTTGFSATSQFHR